MENETTQKEPNERLEDDNWSENRKEMLEGEVERAKIELEIAKKDVETAQKEVIKVEKNLENFSTEK